MDDWLSNAARSLNLSIGEQNQNRGFVVVAGAVVLRLLNLVHVPNPVANVAKMTKSRCYCCYVINNIQDNQRPVYFPCDSTPLPFPERTNYKLLRGIPRRPPGIFRLRADRPLPRHPLRIGGARRFPALFAAAFRKLKLRPTRDRCGASLSA